MPLKFGPRISTSVRDFEIIFEFREEHLAGKLD